MCDLHRPSSEAEASGASICCRAEKSEMPIRLCVNNTIDRGPIDAQRSVRMRVFRFLLGFFSLLPSIEGGLRGGGGSEGGTTTQNQGQYMRARWDKVALLALCTYRNWISTISP